MPNQRQATTRALVAFLLVVLTAPAWAQRDYDRFDRRDRAGPNLNRGDSSPERTRSGPVGRERREPDRNRRAPVIRNHRGYVLDQRYRHNRYYPTRGTVLHTLPGERREVHFHGTRYFFHGGVWYRPYGSRFIVVHPPIGLFISVLPPYYTTIWVGGIAYYYAAGVYYTWLPDRHVYVVAAPPSDESVSEPPGTSDELFVYPKQGQSEEQQATDRYQCYSWAKDQTGFDPTVQGGNVPESQHDSKRSDYQRAMKACLEARGYSVQ